jgi:hypothetical protein
MAPDATRHKTPKIRKRDFLFIIMALGKSTLSCSVMQAGSRRFCFAIQFSPGCSLQKITRFYMLYKTFGKEGFALAGM